MSEWILIITMTLATNPGEIRDISPTIVPGFTTQAKCEAASTTITQTLVRQAGNLRRKQSIADNTWQSAPALWADCKQVIK